MQNVISRMARMFPMFILMGFMIVAISFVIGYSNSQAATAYFAQSKVIRETTLLAERASIESVGLWLPYLKFLGLGFILSGIVMALRVIIENLNAAGMEVMSNLPAAKRPPLPKAPWYGVMMPMVMMLGLLIFIIAFIVSLGLSSTASQVFANPIPDIDAAGTGSTLLTQVQAIQTTSAWLVPFKFLGIASEFLAIAMGLGTIIFILTQQTMMIQRGISIARENAKVGQKEIKEKVTA